ncbi:MAG: hypothetical protein LBQ65_08950 [Tannerellaceae bacterium]|jgi:hypothetical protein|nr:hypothetical protein [Tannerellaceae bacterium]
MKTHTQRKICYLLFAFLLAAGLQAQVVIGSLEPAEAAALLQIKDSQAAVAGGATATKGGLLLPRVDLSHASQIRVISSDASEAKKAELTGLLVYNVNTKGELDEGIYEWDGKMWNQLEIVSETSGSSTQKAVVRASELKEGHTPIVRMGIFEFRMNPAGKDWKKVNPQYRLAVDTLGSLTFYHNVARHWDSGDAGTTSFGDSRGISYDALSRDFAPGDKSTWQNFHTPELAKPDFRYDIWLVDHVNHHAYNVQVFRADTELSTPIHALLVTEY